MRLGGWWSRCFLRYARVITAIIVSGRMLFDFPQLLRRLNHGFHRGEWFRLHPSLAYILAARYVAIIPNICLLPPFDYYKGCRWSLGFLRENILQ